MRRQTVARTHDYFPEDLDIIDRYALKLNMTKVGIIRRALELLDEAYQDAPAVISDKKPATVKPPPRPKKSELGRW